MYVGANRKAAGIAMLVLLCAMAAFVALCPPHVQRRAPPIAIEMSAQQLPARAREALSRPHVREYLNLAPSLPVQGHGYYLEHRIEGADEHERIVRGLKGEVFYTTDNYRTVYRVR